MFKKLKITALALLLILGCISPLGITAQAAEEQVYLGGTAFGVKYFTKGVLVVGLCTVEGFGSSVCPATEAGIKKGDIIVSANGTELKSADDFKKTIEETGIICASALLTTTMSVMGDICALAKDKGIKVMVGGAPLSADFAESIGAYYAADAAAAADVAIKLLTA